MSNFAKFGFVIGWVMALGIFHVQAVDVPPGHRGLDMACETCHTTDSWKEMKEPIAYDHAQTGFLLEDGHRDVSCVTCHVGGDFVTIQSTCQTCHKDVHRAENGADCQRCHTARSWMPTQSFDMHQMTRFPLLGMHATVDCQTCHVNQQKNEFVGLATDCYACHAKDYENARAPDHVVAQFDRNCEQCHPVSTPSWSPSTFDHNQTGFGLAGAHGSTDCVSCHSNGVFAGTPTDCYTCHKLDYDRVKEPDHALAGFDTQCATCHTDATWSPSTFDHEQTGFTLVGAHRSADCASCHANGVFVGTPKDCFSCHQRDYESTQNPNHVLAQFSAQCLDCHTQNAWSPALFDHNQTRFSLTGAHSTTECANCHANGVFANTPMDCFSCHESEYTRARDPNHASARFPQECEQCHNTNRWEPANFNHRQYFPIYSGEHRGEWNTCADCHIQPSDFKAFSCVTCHEHRKSKMDSEHRGRRNYVYQSQACYNCHPNGEE